MICILLQIYNSFVIKTKLRLEMAQEKLRQQQVKELEDKEQELENIKASTQKKVCSLLLKYDIHHKFAVCYPAHLLTKKLCTVIES